MPDVTSQPVAVTYLALGLGVQSSYLLACSALGLHGVPRADLAIFADTQDEPSWVSAQWDWAQRYGPAYGIPVVRVSVGRLSEALRRGCAGEQRYPTIPAWTRGEDGRAAPLPRQCTRDWKIEVMEAHVRGAVLGYRPRQRNRHHVRCMLGISLDERGRMKRSPESWVSNAYPLVDARLTRADCVRGLQELGLPVPRKSSCVYCPYHSDDYWLELQRDYPADYAAAVAVDRVIRDGTAAGRERPAYLHRSLRPLEEIDFAARVAERDARRYPLFTLPPDMADECDGVCGV